MSARRDDPDARHPFDMTTFANNMLAGMAARHSPATDADQDNGERWNAETREEYEQYLQSTEHKP